MSEAIIQEDERDITANDEIIRFNSAYNEKMNSFKQVHLRKKQLFIGDIVLLQKDFDNNTATRKGYFDGFFDEKEYVIQQFLPNNQATIVHEDSQVVVPIHSLKRTKKSE